MRGVAAAALLALAGFWSACASADETASVPAQPDGPRTKLTLSAVIAEGAKPMHEAVQWTVTRADGAEVVATEISAKSELALAPGNYLVTAQYGSTVISSPVALGDAAANHVVNLNSGMIRMKMIPNAGAQPVTGPVTWEVYQYSRGAPEERRQVTVARAPQHEFVLPAGYYIVRAIYDDTTSELVVPVEAGHTYKYTVNLYAGQIGLAAIGSNGKTVSEPVAWEIVRATPNAAGELETVTADVVPSRTFTLREGSYIARARTGEMFGEAAFEVRAGKSGKIKVQLKPAPRQETAGG